MLPGDVILARREGVIVIPPQLAEEVVVTAEIVAPQGRVRPPPAAGGRLHARTDRRPLDRPDQGRLLQVARRRARSKPPIPDAEIEKHL